MATRNTPALLQALIDLVTGKLCSGEEHIEQGQLDIDVLEAVEEAARTQPKRRQTEPKKKGTSASVTTADTATPPSPSYAAHGFGVFDPSGGLGGPLFDSPFGFGGYQPVPLVAQPQPMPVFQRQWSAPMSPYAAPEVSFRQVAWPASPMQQAAVVQRYPMFEAPTPQHQYAAVQVVDPVLTAPTRQMPPTIPQQAQDPLMLATTRLAVQHTPQFDPEATRRAIQHTPQQRQQEEEIVVEVTVPMAQEGAPYRYTSEDPDATRVAIRPEELPQRPLHRGFPSAPAILQDPDATRMAIRPDQLPRNLEWEARIRAQEQSSPYRGGLVF